MRIRVNLLKVKLALYFASASIEITGKGSQVLVRCHATI